MKSLKRKNYSLDEAKIKKLRRLLKTKTETEALQKAVDLVLLQRKAAKVCALPRNPGREQVCTMHPKNIR